MNNFSTLFIENAVLSYSHQETLYVKSGQKVYIRLTSNTFNSLNRPEDKCDEKTESSYNDVSIYVRRK